jgi:PPP4R2
MPSGPFTIQRLVDLCATPRENYTALGKYCRTLEKTLYVTSTWDFFPTLPLQPLDSMAFVAARVGLSSSSALRTPLFSPITFLHDDARHHTAISQEVFVSKPLHLLWLHEHCADEPHRKKRPLRSCYVLVLRIREYLPANISFPVLTRSSSLWLNIIPADIPFLIFNVYHVSLHLYCPAGFLAFIAIHMSCLL